VEIVGVIDVRGGRAVHAVAGQRERYRPVSTAAGIQVDGDPVALARVYVERLNIRELYVADLDAIIDTAQPAGVIRDIAAVGVPLLVDAGVTSAAAARDTLARGAGEVIVGLETLPSWPALDSILGAIGADHVAFSIDLRNGEPLRAAGAAVPENSAEEIAARAVQAGIHTIVLIDLVRVGADAGLDCELIARVRSRARDVRLMAGGGVRGQSDLERLAEAGCDAALVATALHKSRIKNH
jgi:phosphoribosylformimino-5-aminoimidazole carboxamide ribotide isomerase